MPSRSYSANVDLCDIMPEFGMVRTNRQAHSNPSKPGFHFWQETGEIVNATELSIPHLGMFLGGLKAGLLYMLFKSSNCLLRQYDPIRSP